MSEIKPEVYWIKINNSQLIHIAECSGEFWVIPGTNRSFKSADVEIIEGPIMPPKPKLEKGWYWVEDALQDGVPGILFWNTRFWSNGSVRLCRDVVAISDKLEPPVV